MAKENFSYYDKLIEILLFSEVWSGIQSKKYNKKIPIFI